jgi:hypothetical protein
VPEDFKFDDLVNHSAKDKPVAREVTAQTEFPRVAIPRVGDGRLLIFGGIT